MRFWDSLGPLGPILTHFRSPQLAPLRPQSAVRSPQLAPLRKHQLVRSPQSSVRIPAGPWGGVYVRSPQLAPLRKHQLVGQETVFVLPES